MKPNTTLITGPIAPALLKFALPFMLSSFLQALYGAADLFVVGQFADSAGVAAVSIGSQMMHTITGMILGISMGSTVLLGRAVGENNPKRAAKAVGTTAVFFGIMALIFTPLMLLLTGPSVTLMQTPPEAVEATGIYLFICACGIPFIIGYNAVSGIFRGMGDSKTPVYFIALACVINIGLDFLLVGGFHMAAAGAAIATVMSQAISFLAALLYMAKKGFAFPFCKKDFRLDRTAAFQILKVGFPLALQDALVNVSFLAITVIFNTMGLVASAAVGVAEKIIIFAMLPPSSFASAVATMTAQNIGAAQPKRALSALWYGIGFSLIFGILIFVASQFFSQQLTGIFTSDPAVIIAAADYLRAFSIDCMAVGFVFCMNAYFSGCGNSMISFIHSMLATFGVRIPLTWFLSLKVQDSLYIMGFAAPAASLLSIVICFAYLFFRQRRERLRYRT